MASWVDAALQVFKVGASVSEARDARKAAETRRAQDLQIQADANAALARNDLAGAEALQAQGSRLAYASTASPGTIAPQSEGSALDQFLPFIIIGFVSFAAFAVLRK